MVPPPGGDLSIGGLPAGSRPLGDVPGGRSAAEVCAADVFERAMAGAEPFEPAPHLVVAVSGGADSMALCLLARDWAVARGGRVTALTVDHGLRPGSRAEAATVAGWMTALGIDHRILAWGGEKPETAIQARARAARRELLVDWCAAAGVLHLLVGQHRRDQQETVLLRLLRGSGARGLAGMAGVVDDPRVRLLRPLLGCEPSSLRRLLVERDQAWVEDPSNRDPRFARTGARAILAVDAAAGPSAPGVPPFRLGDALSATADAAGESRRRREVEVARLLAAGCTVHEAGWAEFAREALLAAPRSVASAALGAVVAMVGGTGRQPSAGRVERVCAPLFASGDAGTALGRCRLLARAGVVSIFREQRGLPTDLPLRPGAPRWWDGRFRLRLVAAVDGTAPDLRVRPATEGDLRHVRRAGRAGAPGTVPRLARVTMPVLSNQNGVYLVLLPPHLREEKKELQRMGVEAVFCPRLSATGAGYFLVPDNSRIIS